MTAEGKAATVRRLYTPAMLAELVSAPIAAIRRWHRQGALRAVRSVRRLPYFDFGEVAVARRLAQLHAAGCSLRTIDRRLEELARLLPQIDRPLADAAVVIAGKQLFLRRGADLAEPSGQLLLHFERSDSEHDDERLPNVIALPGVAGRGSGFDASSLSGAAAAAWLDQMEQQALDWEDEGHLQQAAECYRTMLLAQGPRAEIQFALADVLYRAGDLPAARERYYAALELDEEYVEARASLGCLLAEMDELELAVATFQGALAFHPDFADVHFHLGQTFERLGRPDEASAHLRAFLELAPESPWAEAARGRLAMIGILADQQLRDSAANRVE